MSDVFVWDRQFETGIPKIDQQHRKLVKLINALGKLLVVETDKEHYLASLQRVLAEMSDYVIYHFRFEQALMQHYQCDAEHVITHQHAHGEFIQQVSEAQRSANDHPAAVTGRLITYLSKWLTTHIIGTDMRMAKMVLAIKSGVPEKEAMKQADSFMINSSALLLDAMNHLYDNLASRTQVLLETKLSLDREILIRKVRETELIKFASAVQHSPISIIITDEKGEFEYVNPKFTEVSGYSMDDLAGKTPRVLKSKGMPADGFENMWSILAAGHEWRGELRNRKKNGDKYWDYVAISPIFDVDGKIVHYVSIQENITLRKQAEDALRQQKQYSEDIVKSLPGIFYMLDQQGRFIEMNPKLVELTGYSKDELAHMTALDCFEGEDKDKVAHKIQETLEKGDASIEVELTQKSGKRIPLHITGHRTNINEQTYLIGIGTDITERAALIKDLEHQAKIDLLTGLFNRRHFIDMAEQELVRTRRYNNQLSLLMLDLDKFKTINDEYGHQAGDAVLRTVGNICRHALREVDIVGRIGGEEFAVVLPQSDPTHAKEVAERLRQEIANAEIFLVRGDKLNFTASIGITSLTKADTNLDNLLELADRALYEAKHNGRNRVFELYH